MAFLARVLTSPRVVASLTALRIFLLNPAFLTGLLGGAWIIPAWHEFIAYSVQFDLMDRELKSKVLANYPDARAFQFPESVNPIVYAADPDEFGVSSYLFTEANSGPRFIGQLLVKEVPFSVQEFEFLWLD